MSISKSPWKRRDRSVHDANDRLVAICFGGTPGEAEGNAQLASAAPEMLEALEGIVQLIKSYVSDFKYTWEYRAVCAAIKKAGGEGMDENVRSHIGSVITLDELGIDVEVMDITGEVDAVY